MLLGILLVLAALAGSALLTYAAVLIFGSAAWYVAGGLLCFAFILLILGRVGLNEILTEGLRRIWAAKG